MNYYNEHDPKTAAWLRELIRRKLIPQGEVDERSICEVQPVDLVGFVQCHFFAGIGGWSLALQLAGWPEDRPVWTGSCPCQPFSSAGKQLAQADERHLWPVFFELIKQCRPELVFGEQVANAIGKGWLDGISADLEAEDYTCGAAVLGAHSVGAPHIRQRLFWLAHAQHSERREVKEHRGHEFHGHDEGREETHRQPGACGEVRGLADANGSESGHGELQCSRGLVQQPENETALRMADTESRGQRINGSASGQAGHLDQCGAVDEWKRVVFSCECDDDGNCPICGIDYADCGCFGPPQDGVEYEERADGLYARWLVQPLSARLEGHTGNGDHGNQPGRLHPSTSGPVTAAGGPSAWSDFDLIPCLDGKTRRVESGTFPLAHGVPARVVKLRGYGNAIVPQVAAQFILASLEALQCGTEGSKGNEEPGHFVCGAG